MTVHLDHLLVPSRDMNASAKLLAEILGVRWEASGEGSRAPSADLEPLARLGRRLHKALGADRGYERSVSCSIGSRCNLEIIQIQTVPMASSRIIQYAWGVNCLTRAK
jgi:hypothetical protein